MTLPGRTSTGNDYRYGFQGQEKDDELKGPGNSLNYTFRMHDPRVGRFLSRDPLYRSYPWNSDYAFAENRVIEGIDLEGGEYQWFMEVVKAGTFGKTAQQIANGIDKSAEKFAQGIVFTVKNPKQVLKGTGNFLLGATIKSTGLPSSTSESTLQYLDKKFGTATIETTKAFESGIIESTNKLIYGNLEDRTEVLSDILLGILSTKGADKIVRLGKVAILTKVEGKISITLGKNVNLKNFASKQKSISFHDFDDLPGYTDAKPSFYNFEDSFKYATESVLNTKGTIKFNLEFVDIKKAGQIKPGTGLYEPLESLSGKSLWEMNMTTEWELNKVLNDPKLLKNTEFYKMDKKVPTETVTKLSKE